ncbi:hypothetical protein [Streptomyces sp. SID3343]|uniref:hypothetical protein n=1 Tax=Streptomyces sp. SID3343 TaxID=2690260 RepID=UPI0013BF6812|nr:hypothetical protein [Streptomyces sp. SID3343]MYW02175.1 hypothetical protein [Streptomyces sp. SID3343]
MTIDKPWPTRQIAHAWLTWAADRDLSKATTRLREMAESHNADAVLGIRIEVHDRTRTKASIMEGTKIATEPWFYVYGTAVRLVPTSA